MQQVTGHLRKMHTSLDETGTVNYKLPIDDELISLNEALGQKITITFTKTITCIHCNSKTNKSFNQGYCYKCFQRLAECDSCIMSPEKCHYYQGTCRDENWADKHCMMPHTVYLSNTSKAKVGITRNNQLPTRFIDQGATQALPIMQVQTRQLSGFIEVIIKQHISDKTSWQNMLKSHPVDILLAEIRDELLTTCFSEITELQDKYGILALNPLLQAPILNINYPVLHYPKKVRSYNLDKEVSINDTLVGIKGQYLILSDGVINIRKYTGYQVDFSIN